MFFVGIIAIPLMLAGGFVFRDMWTWFVVPLGMPAINLAHAIGLASILKGRWAYKSEKGHEWYYLPLQFVSLGFVWLIGYIVKGYM